MTPTIAEQRQQFDEWFYGLGHQAYLAKVAERGGTPLDDPESAFELYRLRWKQPEAPKGLLTNIEEIRSA
jgi:hypothetical protein